MVVVVLMALVVAAPAGATNPSGDRQYRPISRLTDRVESEIALYESYEHGRKPAIPLPSGDTRSRIERKALRAAALIGRLRSQAHDALHILLDVSVEETVEGFGPSTTHDEVTRSLEAAGAAPSAIRSAEPVAADWIEFQGAIERLRAVVAPLSTERSCPIDGTTWFTNEWGADRSYERDHSGLDMHAAPGTPLLAVEDGVVIQASWHWLGGRQVYFQVDSTGDVYYYAHLDYWPKWLWTGTRLEAGDYLGLAGASGNADSSHLHLGWMPGSGAVDLDGLKNPYYLMFELCVP